jgi:hypothetical protein
LNRVFDVIGFVYPNYCLPVSKRGLKRKGALKTSSTMPKQKKVKNLTCRPKSYYMERVAGLPALTAAEYSKTKTVNLSEVVALPPKVMSLDFSLTLSLVVNDLILFWNFGTEVKGNQEKSNYRNSHI